MKNKILIELIVPDIDKKFMLFVPINKKVGNIIVLLNKSIAELSGGLFVGNSRTSLYNKATGEKLHFDALIRNTNVRNGSTLILI